MKYFSTRGKAASVSSSMAVLKGIAEDGGLYVPQSLPQLSADFIQKSSGDDYKTIAKKILPLFLTDYSKEELDFAVDSAYDKKFETKEITPIHKAGNLYYLELFRGRTIAFKDMALSILPHLMTIALKKQGIKEEIVILTATSGDTGKAALAGFADVAGTKIIVFYPKDGVSKIQKLQMVTQEGENVSVIGLNGNFDDAQRGVKEIFSDTAFQSELKQKGYLLSSANSINIGRLIPQIVYYVYSYSKMYTDGEIKEGELLDVAVPSGNFGNILAAYVAKAMGLPLGKLICASNENNVLTDFMKTGVYDKNRKFILTTSPSMDILVSSNLERLLYFIADGNTDTVTALMRELSSRGVYKITDDMKSKLNDFDAYFADVDECAKKIAEVFLQYDYCIDPHTAVAAVAADKYSKARGSKNKILVVSTASPYKFPETVLEAISTDKGIYDKELLKKLSEITKTPVPMAVGGIYDAPVLHETVVDYANMIQPISAFLK